MSIGSLFLWVTLFRLSRCYDFLPIRAGSRFQLIRWLCGLRLLHSHPPSWGCVGMFNCALPSNSPGCSLCTSFPCASPGSFMGRLLRLFVLSRSISRWWLGCFESYPCAIGVACCRPPLVPPPPQFAVLVLVASVLLV